MSPVFPRLAWQRFCWTVSPYAKALFCITWLLVLGWMIRTSGEMWPGEAMAWMTGDNPIDTTPRQHGLGSVQIEPVDFGTYEPSATTNAPALRAKAVSSAKSSCRYPGFFGWLTFAATSTARSLRTCNCSLRFSN